MEDVIFADKEVSLKEYLESDHNNTNYNKMYSILQNGLRRISQQEKTASTREEADELSGLRKIFIDSMSLLEKTAVFSKKNKSY